MAQSSRPGTANAETVTRSREIQTVLSKFFAPPSDESRRYREQRVGPDSEALFRLVTPEAMQILVDSTPESREFNARLKVAAQKARDTPIVRPDGIIVRNWIHGDIALAIDSRGNVLGFDSSPPERAKFLTYQVPKALRARVLSEQANDGERDPSREDNIRLLARLGVEPKYQYTGAKDDVQLPVGSELRWVYVVGGATKPDEAYAKDVYGPSPKGYSKLDGVEPLEAEMDDIFGGLVLHYLMHPDAEVKPIPEPASITRARALLRNVGQES